LRLFLLLFARLRRARANISLPPDVDFVQVRPMGRQNEPTEGTNSSASGDAGGEDGITVGSLLLAAIPLVALMVGPFFANRLEPRIWGLPFLLAYCVFWVLLTPVFLFLVDRLRKRR
jgi:hypothetical protein